MLTLLATITWPEAMFYSVVVIMGGLALISLFIASSGAKFPWEK